ncbi:DUF4339 domain-containing protein [Microcoleus vaginatus PCC 9802]|uniref:DUF4339 domain-containing protein n=2 Tax=Microcoleus vaginatus TaxID=119532 RepID=UPI00020D17E3|nr:hypothetical protein MicvaDRAFT_0394 [Microcoleus vaginatus FGP-2]UNU20586.1 DUF4339 domain-containing protein [Microcoleus vaginatus PCC 9802]
MKIPSWPAWFPYPISWLRGFVLSRSFGFFVISGIPEVSNTGDFFILLTVAWLVQPFLFTFLHYLSATTIEAAIIGLPSQVPNYDRIHQWLTSKRCSGTWRHWREGLNAFVVLFFGFFFSLFVGALIIAAPSDRESSMWKLTIALSCLPVATAYLYQYDLWARQRRAAKQEKRSQNSTAPAANPIEQELNQLRADAGATRMRPVRQATPEVADWYVFRSGKAEGPYTALQLWEVQKITDRTKVRRGEGDWQRAGEVSELTKYLTQQ